MAELLLKVISVFVTLSDFRYTMKFGAVGIAVLACLLQLSTAATSARKVQERTFCPSEFVLLQGHCYYFSQEIVNNWDEAWRLCQELDPQAVLANLETLKEWKLLKTYLIEEKLSLRNWWIGGSHRDNDRKWTWMGTNQAISYSDWCPNQPDNALGNEDCLHITNINNRLCWNDLHCTHNPFGFQLNFICEL